MKRRKLLAVRRLEAEKGRLKDEKTKELEMNVERSQKNTEGQVKLLQDEKEFSDFRHPPPTPLADKRAKVHQKKRRKSH